MCRDGERSGTGSRVFTRPRVNLFIPGTRVNPDHKVDALNLVCVYYISRPETFFAGRLTQGGVTALPSQYFKSFLRRAGLSRGA